MKKLFLWILAALLLMMPGVVSAGSAEFFKSHPTAQGIYRAGVDVPSVVVRIGERTKGATPREMAEKFLSKNLPKLGFSDATFDTLKYKTTIGFRDIKIVVFDQYAAGKVPVFGAVAKVIIKDGAIERLSQSLVDATKLGNVHPALSASSAVVNALSLDSIPKPAHANIDELAKRTQLVIDSVSVEAPLCWVVNIDMHKLGPYNYYVFVNAKNGTIERVWNRVYFENMVNVFNPNPGADGSNPAEEVQIERLNQPQGDDHLTSDHLYVTGCPDMNESIQINYQGYNLNVPICSEVATAEEDENGDFLFTPYIDANGNSPFSPAESRDDKFAEGQMYYHTDIFYSWLQGLSDLLEDGTVTVADPFDEFRQKPFKGVVNFKMPNYMKIFNPQAPGDRLMEFDNAFYMPAGQLFPGYTREEDSVMFGQGTDVDFSYDADVIYHELTHAMIDTVAGLLGDTRGEYGTILDPGAMNEGYADFFSASFTNDPHMADYVGSRLGEHGEASLRELDNDLACPSYMWGEVHQDSMHWSGALWEIREALKDADTGDASVITAAVLEGIAQLVPQPTYDEAAELTLAAIEDLLGADARATAEGIMAEHNVIGCERVIDMTDSINTPKDKMFLPSPGSINLNRAPGYMQFKYTITDDTHNQILIGFYRQQVNMGSFGQQPPLNVYAVIKKDGLVAFTYSGTRVEHDGFKEVEFEKLAQSDKPGYEQYRAIIGQEWGEEWPGAGDYYIAILNATSGGGMAGSLMPDIMEDIVVFSMHKDLEPPEDGDVDSVEEEIESTSEDEVAESSETMVDGDKEEPAESEQGAELAEDESGSEEPAEAPSNNDEKEKSSSSDDGCAGGASSALFLAAAALAALRRRRR